MQPIDSRGMAAMYLSLTDDEPLERRRPLLAVLACCLFMALATPVGWALATGDALAAPVTKAATTGDDDPARAGGGDDDDDATDADDSRATVSGTDNSISSPNTGSHSVTNASRSTPGNSVSNPATSHSVTRPSVSSSDNSRSGQNTSHSLTGDESASTPGNSASNQNTSHSVTRR